MYLFLITAFKDFLDAVKFMLGDVIVTDWSIEVLAVPSILSAKWQINLSEENLCHLDTPTDGWSTGV